MVERHGSTAVERRQVGRLARGDALGVPGRAGDEPRILPVTLPGVLAGLRRGPERAGAATAEIAEARDVDDAGGVVRAQLQLEVGAKAQARGSAADPPH